MEVCREERNAGHAIEHTWLRQVATGRRRTEFRLFLYMGTSIYSTSEVFIGRSLMISRYPLTTLKGI